MTDVETTVIGAGVVGLACAAELARSGRDVVVIERESVIGQGISSRNSEVIHAGIYYEPTSLKAELCVVGRDLLYEYCSRRSIPVARLGKLIVATDPTEINALKELRQTGSKNGVKNLTLLDANNAMAMQPGLQCVAALHSPDTGVVDSHVLMMSLHADIESQGGIVVFKSDVQSISSTTNHHTVTLTDGTQLTTKELINSSGLNSIRLSQSHPSLQPSELPKAQFAKGNYFKLIGSAPFNKLIYPAPVVGGLGIHLTIDLAGAKRFGPDVQWLDNTSAEPTGFNVDPKRAEPFYSAIRKYWPGLPDNSLSPDYAGIRPKAVLNNKTDFFIHGPAQHGVTGLVNLMGIESPGLTSSLAIAEKVHRCVDNAKID